jgi:poly(3-hydroxybutyrate) depolymerase
MLQDPASASRGSSRRAQAAACQVFELAEVTHRRPPWRSTRCSSRASGAGREEGASTTPFATLLRFRKPASRGPAEGAGRGADERPLRDPAARHGAHRAAGSTTSMSPTGTNVRDVPFGAGRFGLDEYTEHLIDFLARWVRART